MSTWPLIQRNKVEDSKISIPVAKCAELQNEVISGLARKVGIRGNFSLQKLLTGLTI